MRIVTALSSDTPEGLPEAVERMEAELVPVEEPGMEGLRQSLRRHPDLVVIDPGAVDSLQEVRAETRARRVGMVVVCATPEDQSAAIEAETDEWVYSGAPAIEVRARLECAAKRAGRGGEPQISAQVVEHLRYEELLYDRFTGFPTLPVMLERGREMLERTGSLTVLYIEFVRYTKLEEVYGWQRLDAVLQTTAHAVRSFYDRRGRSEENVLMVSHTGDDDFVFFTDLSGVRDLEQAINELGRELEEHIREQLEEAHGEDIAGLFGIYVGATTLYRNPKIRTERMIYRGIREAQHVARSVEQRERSRKVAELRTLLRRDAVFIEYHPIVVTADRSVYGYEALARGRSRGLRSPEVMFDVAEEANLIWELSRLCRRRAIEGMNETLEPEHLLFLNIDPHDFRDPTFRDIDPEELGVDDPTRIVLEITERTAITDYPAFQEYLKKFRAMGFRFAVDDAGSGYAGLGSIANLAPDFIKLDISLISNIDSNYMKQNLVETMVAFANDQGVKVIAEGVEQEEEYETVRQIGVHLSQGFLFHDPRFAGKEVA